MSNVNPVFILFQLDALRTELVDLAFDLDQRGQPAAVDVAMMVAARLDELRAQRADADAEPSSREESAALSGATRLVR